MSVHKCPVINRNVDDNANSHGVSNSTASRMTRSDTRNHFEEKNNANENECRCQGFVPDRHDDAIGAASLEDGMFTWPLFDVERFFARSDNMLEARHCRWTDIESSGGFSRAPIEQSPAN